MRTARIGATFYTLLAFTLILTLAGCDVFETLDTEPQNSVPASQALTDAQGANSVLLGLYDDLQGFMDDYTIFSALAADQAQHEGSFPSWSAVDNHTMQPSSPEAAGQWNGFYNAINTANLLVEQATSDLKNLSEPEAEAIRAQARTVRAFCYHGLIRWFGGHGSLDDMGVPIILKPTQNVDDVTFPSREDVGTVYQQILTDLNQAESMLEGNPNEPSENGFVDNLVIDALQARVYLYRASIERRATGSATSDYEAARDNAEEVLNVKNTLTSLNANYTSLNSAEAIWELQYSSTDANSMSFFARRNGDGGRFEYGLDGDRLSEVLNDPLDDRLDVNVKVYQNPLQGPQPWIGKYFRLDGADHHFILRLPEVKLIHAEALTFLDLVGNESTIIAHINDIRRRSYNEDNEGDPTVEDFQEAGAEITSLSSQSQALAEILAERKDELAFEGHRWHDLNRLGMSQSVLGLASENLRRFPVPQSELDVNDNLKQNPGF